MLVGKTFTSFRFVLRPIAPVKSVTLTMSSRSVYVPHNQRATLRGATSKPQARRVDPVYPVSAQGNAGSLDHLFLERSLLTAQLPSTKARADESGAQCNRHTNNAGPGRGAKKNHVRVQL